MSNNKLLWSLIIGVIVLWLSTPMLVATLYSDMTSRGQFGDIFGSVNALFSGLAFVGLFYTIQLQREQLQIQHAEFKLQRQELELQRNEMAASRGELANQVKMQRALIRATIAQINVAAVNAQIEAKKMESEMFAPTGRQDQCKYIALAADTLSALADKLEKELPNTD
jgi:hypothetical protein